MGPLLPLASAAPRCQLHHHGGCAADGIALPAAAAALPLLQRHGGCAAIRIPLPAAAAAVLRLEAGDHAVQVPQQLLYLRPPPLQPHMRWQV